ncbi:hypothetical protein [Streptomyces sp. JNUCC 63]
MTCDDAVAAAAGPGVQVVLDAGGRVVSAGTRGGAVPADGAVLQGIGSAADWLSTTGLTSGPAQSPGTPLPALTAPTGRRTGASVRSSRGRRKAASTVLPGGAAAALFAAAAAPGASLNSDGTSPSAPQPPAPAAVPITSLNDPQSPVTAHTTTPPAQFHGSAGNHEHRGKQGKGGGRDRGSDD